MPRTVLLLDDDAQFRASVTPALEAFGLRVLSANKGSIALAMLQEEAPSLLVVDGLLPDINGIVWIEELRNAGIQTPIIFVSAFYRDLATFKHLTHDLDVLKVFHKPVSVDRFAREVAATVAPPSAVPASGPPAAANGDDWDDEDTLIFPGDQSARVDSKQEQLRQSYKSILPVAADNLTGIVHQVQVQPERPSLLAEALRQANDLHGTAGSYGLEPISLAAAEVEAHLRELQRSGRVDWENVFRSIELVRKEAAIAVGEELPVGPSAVAPPSVTSAAAFMLHEQPTAELIPSLLVLEDDQAMIAYLRSAFDEVLVQLRAVSTLEEALESATSNPPCAVLLGWPLADRNAPARFVKLFRGLRGCAQVPLLMLSVDDDLATRRFAAELGVDMFLPHPVQLVRLHEAVQAAIERCSAPALKVAVVRDRDAAVEIEATGLSSLLYFSMDELLRQIPVQQPDVVLLGNEVADPRDAAIVRMCAWDSELALLSFEDSALAGSSDLDGCVDRDAGWIVEVHRHAERVAQRRRVPLRCPQTGLLTHRAAVSALESGLSSAQRHGHTYSVGFIRTLGDKELDPLAFHRQQTFLGRLIAGRFRREDVRGRWNEDTFAVGFDGASARAIVSVVQRLQAELESEHGHPQAGTDPPRIAVGLAAYPLDGDTHRSLICIAHERLETAVEQGPGALVWR